MPFGIGECEEGMGLGGGVEKEEDRECGPEHGEGLHGGWRGKGRVLLVDWRVVEKIA